MKSTTQFETQDAKELHAQIQALGAIQKARGDTAKWLAEDRQRFWTSRLPTIGMAVGMPTVLFAGVMACTGGNVPLALIEGAGIFTILALLMYPRH
jgi:hypothetical protein